VGWEFVLAGDRFPATCPVALCGRIRRYRFVAHSLFGWWHRVYYRHLRRVRHLLRQVIDLHEGPRADPPIWTAMLSSLERSALMLIGVIRAADWSGCQRRY
jgi:hypothetical protein